MTEPHPRRIDGTVVVGGKYHDMDYARLQLLHACAEHEQVRVRVVADYDDADSIAQGRFLVSYTCDVRPSLDAQRAIRAWVESGGRWLALHGTNAALDLPGPHAPERRSVEAPRCFPLWASTLGSQFVAHPPIHPFTVEPIATGHPLVEGIGTFSVDDELYLSEYHDRPDLVPLLVTHWRGEAPGFAERDWTSCDDEHLVVYLRPLGRGAVLYNTLGHCRGHHDMAPLTDWYPTIERGAWTTAQYRELVRRGLAWAVRSG